MKIDTANLFALLSRFNSERAKHISVNFPDLVLETGRILGDTTEERTIKRSNKFDQRGS